MVKDEAAQLAAAEQVKALLGTIVGALAEGEIHGCFGSVSGEVGEIGFEVTGIKNGLSGFFFGEKI